MIVNMSHRPGKSCVNVMLFSPLLVFCVFFLHIYFCVCEREHLNSTPLANYNYTIQ